MANMCRVNCSIVSFLVCCDMGGAYHCRGITTESRLRTIHPHSGMVTSLVNLFSPELSNTKEKKSRETKY